VSALQWAIDTRDPISSAHGYAQNIMGWSRICSPVHGLSWERIKEVSARVYGTTDAADPRSGYGAKAIAAAWHGNRSVMKDSLTVGDQVFPRIYSNRTEDNFARAGDMEGPAFERHMFNALTGIGWTDPEMDAASARVLSLERRLLIRNFGRCRADDESVIPYFQRPENLVNPFIGHPMSLDPQAFREQLSELYALRGWDDQGKPLS